MFSFSTAKIKAFFLIIKLLALNSYVEMSLASIFGFSSKIFEISVLFSLIAKHKKVSLNSSPLSFWM